MQGNLVVSVVILVAPLWRALDKWFVTNSCRVQGILEKKYNMCNIIGQYQRLWIQFIYLQYCMAVSGSYWNVVDEIEREKERQMEKKGE